MRMKQDIKGMDVEMRLI